MDRATAMLPPRLFAKGFSSFLSFFFRIGMGRLGGGTGHGFRLLVLSFLLGYSCSVEGNGVIMMGT